MGHSVLDAFEHDVAGGDELVRSRSSEKSRLSAHALQSTRQVALASNDAEGLCMPGTARPVGPVLSQLPTGASAPLVRRFDPNTLAILNLAFTGAPTTPRRRRPSIVNRAVPGVIAHPGKYLSAGSDAVPSIVLCAVLFATPSFFELP